ncbi:MAG TPA: hypothetical protein VF245_00725 [Solirubrobacterales bacterium]
MRRALLPLLAACACLLAPPTPAAADRVLDSHCSPSGDYCTAVVRSRGRIKLVLRTFSFRGSYELCVRPPGLPRECKSFRLFATRHGIYASRVDLARNFVTSRRGRYAVSWRYEGFRVGPALHFRKR